MLSALHSVALNTGIATLRRWYQPLLQSLLLLLKSAHSKAARTSFVLARLLTCLLGAVALALLSDGVAVAQGAMPQNTFAAIGSTNNGSGNGALSFTSTGGLTIASGSVFYAQPPSGFNFDYPVTVTITGTQNGGVVVQNNNICQTFLNGSFTITANKSGTLLLAGTFNSIQLYGYVGSNTITFRTNTNCVTFTGGSYFAASGLTNPGALSFSGSVNPALSVPGGQLSSFQGSATGSFSAAVPFVMSVKPAMVIGGSASVGTVTIGAPAPTGGYSVALSSNSASATVPASVTVPAGQTTTTFPVETTAVAASVAVTVSATAGNYTVTAPLAINPPSLLTLRVAPATVAGGQSSSGTITLSGPAPSSGTVITLSSSNATATVPANVTVPAGTASVSFPVTTTAVSGNMQCVVSATLGAKTLTAPLTVTGATALSLKVAPASVVGGNTAQGTVTLSSPAPAGGAAVTLSCNSQATGVTVPTQVTVAAGAKAVSFALTTQAVGTILVANVSATEASNSAAAPLIVIPPALTGLTLSPISVVAGQYSTGTVTISSPAPSNGLLIPISSDNAAATVPSAAVIAAGATSGTFPIATYPITASSATTSTTINDTNSGITYTGSGWFYSADRGLGDVGDDVHATANNGDSVSYTFTGTGISYVTETNSDEGNVQVYVDGVLQATINCATATRMSQQAVYSVSSLAQGPHTISLVKVSGSYMLLDAFQAASASTVANISATFSGITASAALEITSPSSVLTSIVVTPSNAVVQTGATQQFTATALDQNGVALATQPSFTWSVGNGAGSISTSTGLFTAGSNAGGPFTVTATAGNVSGTATVTVETSGTPSSPLTPFTTVKNTKWTIAGYGGMRFFMGGSGYGTGAITISGVNGTVTQAYLYWHGPTNSTDPTVNAAVTFNGNNITGTNIGFASDNYWGYYNSQAYRADVTSLVPEGLVNGGGTFSLSNFVRGAGTTYGPDDLPRALADINGVTLIVFYNDGTSTGNRNVMIFDGNDSNFDEKSDGNYEWNDTFSSISYTAGTTANLWLGVSDGQYAPDGAVFINGNTLLSTGDNFDGDTPNPPVAYGPSVQGDNGGLWDIRSFNITSFLSPGNNTLNLVSPVYDDYLSLIYAIVDQPANGNGGGSSPSSSPIIATAASANPNPVTGATTDLSVLGADANGEVYLTYTWSIIGPPPSPVFLSLNGINAAKNTVATFTQAGTYMFQVTVRNQAGLTATSYVTVTVNQTLSSLAVTPATATVPLNGTQQFTAAMTDQFGTPLSSPPAVTWSVASGGGSISSSGLYTAGTTPGAATVQAAVGAMTATATITIANAAPTIVMTATANPNPVPGTTTALSVLSTDDGGESNLAYTWATTGTPPALVTYSVNGTNAAKNCTATFTRAGSYTFEVVVRDAGGLTATSSVNVTVNQTLTAITVSPSTAALNPLATQQFTAAGMDQFGTALNPQPSFTWSLASGSGSVSSSGLYTAPASAGSASVEASSGNINGTATVTVTATTAPILTSIVVTPSPVSVSTNNTQQFTATALDQNGAALNPQPSFTWSLASGSGSVSSSGLYTAPATVGSASVEASSGSISGTATIMVTNAAAPTIAMTAMANPNPVTAKTTTLSVLGADASGESNLTYTWATTGTPPAPVTYSANGTNAAKNCTATFTKAGSYTFQVTVQNGAGLTATSNVTVTVNQTLIAIAVSPRSAAIQTGGTEQYAASATDQFGQTLAMLPTFTWTASGGGAIGSANGTFVAGTTVGGPFTITATAGSVSGTATVTLIATVPVATPVIAIAGGDGSAVVSITDGTPGATIFYTTDGTTPTSASPPYQGAFVVTSTTTIEAIAYLSGSSSAVAIATATVTTGASGAVPGVAITSPADGSAQTGGAPGSSPVIPIVGSVSGSSLSSWTLAYRPVAGDDADEGNWIPISAGTAAQPAGSVLGTLDPTLMLNGQYQIELTAYNTAGQPSSALVTILIKGDQKVGYFTLSYNDLTVPISGLPITITRTYDSRNKGLGDFGTGWTLSTTNVQVQKADTIGLDWTEVISGFNYALVPNQSHLITVTFPNGDTYNFVPYIAPQQGDGYDDTGGTINFMPVGPVQGATLISKNNPGGISFVALTTSGGGNAVGVELDADDGSDDDSGYPADEDEFILTLRNGKQFDVSIDDGLESIRDLNGNTISFTPGGIYSSSYSASTPIVSYQRTNGLISQIIGPSGNPLIYTQTGTDLTGFTDRASNLSTYDYDYTHDLTSIHDPRGIQPLRNDYDASGRLQDSVDADQNKITYNYDLTGHTQTVFDRLGHETDFSYDGYGNVTAKTQHLIVGGVDTPITSTSAFGDSNNPDKKTMDTDPLGRVTAYVYQPTGELLTTTQQRLSGGQPVTTSYTYNNFSEPLTVQDANNQNTANYATTSTYDANGNLKTTADALGNTSQFFYNPNGTPDHTTDANGKTTYYFYAAGANYPAGAYVTGVQDALGHTTTFDYDADGNKISQVQTRTNAAGGTDTLATSYQYDANDRLNVSVFPDSTPAVPDTVQTVYNSIGKVDHTVDPLGRTTYYKYDDQGRATETDYQDGTKTLTSYDLNGQRLTSTDKAGRITGNVYDTLGRLTQSGPINAAGNWLTDSSGNPIYSQTSYDADGETLTETDQNGNATTYTYDDLGRKATVTDAAGSVTVYNDASDSGYDLNGNQIKVKDARGNLTRFQYDLDNHLLETDVYKSDGVTLLTSTKTGYDALGRRQTSTDGDGNTTTYNYDAVGRLASVLDARNKTTSYGYDELGEKISQTDANLHTTKFAYDLKGHLIQKTLPVGQSMTMGYNLDGTLAAQTDYNGVTTSYTYEPNAGRLSYKASSTGQWVGYDYYADGSRRDAYRGHSAVSFSAADSTVTNTYDALGRLQTVLAPSGLLTYGYDRAGNKTSLSSPSGTTTYDYDGDNRLWHVYHKDGSTSVYAYDPNGNRQSLSLPASTGIVTSYTYDEANRLTLLTNMKGAATLSSYAYTLLASGRRQSVTDATGGKITYAYDPDGRLISETSTGLTPAIANAYGYDDAGNRTSLNGSTITYDADDRLTSGGHSYDANGNETTVNGQPATYDFENHLASIGNASYTYDADGNHLSATTSAGTTSYLVDTSAAFARVLEEYAGGSLAARYDYGDDLLRMDRTLPTTSTSYYLYDGLGSTRQLVNASGTVTDGYLYDAYGVGLLHSPSSGIVNSFLFQGQQFDAASQDYYQRARYYDPTTGRFLSQDPFAGDTSDPLSLHRYLYASNDPVNNIDPSGNEDYSLSSLSAGQGIGLTLAGISTVAATSVYTANGGNPLVGAVYGTEIGFSLAYGALEGGFTNIFVGALLGGIGSDAIDLAVAHILGQDASTDNFKQKLGRDFIQGAAGGAVAVAFGPASGKQALAIFSFVNTLGQDSIDTINSLATGELVFGSAAFRNKAYQTITDSVVSGLVGYLSGAELPITDSAAESVGGSEAVKEVLEDPALIKKFTDSLKTFFATEVGALQSFILGQVPKLAFPD